MKYILLSAFIVFAPAFATEVTPEVKPSAVIAAIAQTANSNPENSSTTKEQEGKNKVKISKAARYAAKATKCELLAEQYRILTDHYRNLAAQASVEITEDQAQVTSTEPTDKTI